MVQSTVIMIKNRLFFLLLCFGSCCAQLHGSRHVVLTEASGKLRHCWPAAGPSNSKAGYVCEVLYEGVVGQAARIHFGDESPHVFFRTQHGRLVHLWVDEGGGSWRRAKSEILAEDAAEAPVAALVDGSIGVFFFSVDRRLVSLHASKASNWTSYSRSEIGRLQETPSSLLLLHWSPTEVDFYFRQANDIVCIHRDFTASVNFTIQTALANVTSRGDISAVRLKHRIFLFYVDLNGHLSSAVGGCRASGCKFGDQKVISNAPPRDAAFSTIKSHHTNSLFFMNSQATRVYMTKCLLSIGSSTVEPLTLEASPLQPSVPAVIMNNSTMDVFFASKDNVLINYHNGPDNGHKWEQREVHMLLPVVYWPDAFVGLETLDSGYFAKAYLFTNNSERLVVKIYHDAVTSAAEMINNECLMAAKVRSPVACRALVHSASNGQLIGAVMPFIEGRTLDAVYLDPESVFSQSVSARLRLIRAIGLQVKQLQENGVYHADLHLRNVMVHEAADKSSSELVNVTLIDWAVAFSSRPTTRVSKELQIGKLYRPPEYMPGKMYVPTGLNAYQLARLSLIVLLRKSVEEAAELPLPPEGELLELERTGLNKSVIEWLKRGLGHDIDDRLAFLDETESLLDLTNLEFSNQSSCQISHRLDEL